MTITEPAYLNFQGMSPSVQKTYTMAYYDAKTDAGRARRVAWMVERLEKKNLSRLLPVHQRSRP